MRGLLGIGVLSCAAAGFAEEPVPSPLVGWDNQLAGTGSEALPFVTVEAFPGLELNRPTDLDLVPIAGSNAFVAVEHRGAIVWFSEDAPSEVVPIYSNPKRKVFSAAFDPGFPEKPYLYLSGNGWELGYASNFVSRFTVTVEGKDRLAIDPESRIDLIAWASNGHNGCDLKFGVDGMLYISTGDGEPPSDPANVGQTTDNLLGSILRIDVREATPESPYLVPADNPFMGQEAMIRPEVWAYGLRNPWKIAFHPDSDQLFLGDNGDEHWDLVRLVEAGTNHGWSTFEGSHSFRPSNPMAPPQTELTVPVWEHPHTEIRSVIGGYFYQGSKFPQLVGHYVYGCYFTRRLWALDWDGKTMSNARRIADAKLQIVGFTEDRDREILVTTYDGGILRLEERPADAEPPRALPQQLSDTGLFSSVTRLTNAESVFSYEINVPMWQDGATSTQVFALPDGPNLIDAKQGERQKKSWSFPSGSAFAKTIERDGRRIETQVMHNDGGEWKFLTYQWNEEQTDADLIPADGHVDERSGWRFASRAECTSCHTQRSFFVLGLSTEQLRRGNQIDEFRAAGLFKPKRDPFENETRKEAFGDDLDSRARAYLHTNCTHCHRESGVGGRAQFEMMHWLPLAETGMINAQPLVGLPGSPPDSKIIAPGEPEKSQTYQRMVSEMPGLRMPLIGCSTVDKEGAQLIYDWIAATKPEAVEVSALESEN